MSDEEKKAIKKVNYICDKWYDENLEIDVKWLESLLSLCEKQQKEIEELKQIKRQLDEKNIPIETLLAEFERLEDLEDDLTTVYLNGVYDGEKKVQDRIKAKMEEVKDGTYDAKIVLQSFL